MSQLEPIFGITIRNIEQLSQLKLSTEFDITLYDDVINHIVKYIKFLLKASGIIDGRNEIERSRFVDLILTCVVSTFGRRSLNNPLFF